MRLAIVTHNVMPGDGQSRVAYELAKAALEARHEVTLLANYVAPDLLARGAQWVRIDVRCKAFHLLKVVEFAWSANRVLERSRHRYDCVQAFGFTLSCAHEVNNSQFVHRSWLDSPVHTSKVRRGLYGFYQWCYSRLNICWERVAYSHARVVVASSRRIADQLCATGVPRSRIRVIHNGVDLEEFSPGTASRLHLGLPDRVALALFVGDLRTPRKNLETVLEALREVPELHLAVVGETSRSLYPAMAQSAGLAERVHFLGFRADVGELMRAVDLFVFPSRYEACSLVLLEAMASGLPVVTATTAGGAELVSGACGIVLEDPNDTATLIAGLRDLVAQPARRREMAKAARGVAEEHSWATMAAAHLDLHAHLFRMATDAARIGEPLSRRAADYA